MDFNEAYAILGISLDSDENLIKTAYRNKLAETNPEDDPEGFKRLRTAFECACRHVKELDDEKKAEDEIKEDTPADLFVNKIADIYKIMSKRRDINVWKEALNDPDLKSLELEEEYKEKLLVFLMDNYYLPKEIWKLIDDTFGIIASEKALKEMFPVGFVNYMIRSINNIGMEEIDMSLFEGDDEAPYDSYINMYYDSRDACAKGEFNNAITIINDSKNMNIYHPVMDVSYIYVLSSRNGEADKDDALKRVRALLDKYPDVYIVNIALCHVLWRFDIDKNEAFDIAKKLIKENPESMLLNQIMAECLYANGQYADAKEHVYNMLDYGQNENAMDMLNKINDKIRSEYKKKWDEQRDFDALLDWCWCLYQDRKAAKAYSIIKKEENNIPEKLFIDFHRVKARICLTFYDLDEALESSKIAIEGMEKRIMESDEEEKKKNEKRLYNDILVRASAFDEKGLINSDYYEDAVENYKKLLEMNNTDFAVQYAIAKIYRKMGKCEEALQIINNLIYSYGELPAAAEGLECANDLKDAGKLIEYGEICLREFPEYEKPYAYLSDYFSAVEDYDEIEKLLEKAKEKNIDNWYLAANLYLKDHEYFDSDQIETKIKEFDDKYLKKLNSASKDIDKEKVVADARELFNMHPSAYLKIINADAYFNLGMFDEAIELYESAIDEAPRYIYALRRLAKMYFGKSRFEEAIFLRKKSYFLTEEGEYNKEDAEFIAQCYICIGDWDQALSWYKKYEEKSEENDNISIMAKCLALTGQMEEAINMTNADSDSSEDFYDALDTLYKATYRFEDDKEILDELYEKLEKLDAKYWVEEDDINNCKNFCIDKVFSLVNDGFNEEEIVKYIEMLFEHTDDVEQYIGYSQITGVEDFLFMIILLDRKDLWEKYAPILKKWSELRAEQPNNWDLKYPRLDLQRKILYDFYNLTDTEIEQMLSKKEELWMCSHCKQAFCIELTGTELLLLLRMKKFEEAKEKIQKCNELQYDDYVHSVDMAIKNKKGLGNDSRN